MQELTAVETTSSVSGAIASWVDAFRILGVPYAEGKTEVMWVESAGVWIRPRADPDEAGGHWNGLGVELSGQALRNELVQVNPPLSGSPPGRNGGVIATDADGDVWLLRRSQLRVSKRTLELDDYPVMVSRLKIDPVAVRYQDGSAVRYQDGSAIKCYPVTRLGNAGKS
jgi:hypothetical protein